MATSRKEKEEILQSLTDDLKSARGVVFANYRGLTVKDIDKVRKNLRGEKVKYQVVKVTLLKKALESLGIKTDGLQYSGPVAVAISQDEETVPARAIKNMGKDFQNLKIDGGLFNNEVVGIDVITRLASLPSKQELYGQLVSVLVGPQRGLVTVLSGNLKKLVYALNAIAESKK